MIAAHLRELLRNNSIDRQIVEQLRQDGHIVLYVAEMDPGIDDEHVLAQANRQQAILLTADKDFGELVFRLKRLSAGVVLVRLAGISLEKKAMLVSEAFQEHENEFIRNFSVLSPGMVRIRLS